MRDGLLYELTVKFAAGVAPFALRGLLATCRVTVVNDAPLRDARRGTSYIGALWHRHLVVYGDFFRKLRFVVLVSRSRDGEIGARVANRLGFVTVRGSSSSGGAEALKETIEYVKRGHTVAFVADGPRGPAREAKMGVVIAAMKSGRPIVPVACAISKAIRAKSWDRTEIPVPGSRVVVAFGAPIPVSADASREDCERLRQEVTRAICSTEERAQAALTC